VRVQPAHRATRCRGVDVRASPLLRFKRLEAQSASSSSFYTIHFQPSNLQTCDLERTACVVRAPVWFDRRVGPPLCVCIFGAHLLKPSPTAQAWEGLLPGHVKSTLLQQVILPKLQVVSLSPSKTRSVSPSSLCPALPLRRAPQTGAVFLITRRAWGSRLESQQTPIRDRIAN
jgi:hypothetical protein